MIKPHCSNFWIITTIFASLIFSDFYNPAIKLLKVVITPILPFLTLSVLLTILTIHPTKIFDKFHRILKLATHISEQSYVPVLAS